MMDNKISALYSDYVIDGVPRELTPAQMLGGHDFPGYSQIVDESLDPVLVYGTSKSYPMALSASRTLARISQVLLETLWRKGHFRIGDLNLSPSWKWNSSHIGNMAAFYSSVEAFADHVDALGLSIRKFGYKDTDGDSSLDIAVGIDSPEENGGDKPFSVEDPELSEGRLHPDTVRPEPRSWVLYVPFEMVWGQDDPDYFIDCFELVRELVEDNIVLSCRTVMKGGLKKALEDYLKGTGLVVRIAEVKKYFEMTDASRILDDEVPGVLLQIRDIDYDYIDAEFLLQDVAYFPLGNPTDGPLSFDLSDKSGLQTILESIINSQSSEGED